MAKQAHLQGTPPFLKELRFKHLDPVTWGEWPPCHRSAPQLKPRSSSEQGRVPPQRACHSSIYTLVLQALKAVALRSLCRCGRGVRRECEDKTASWIPMGNTKASIDASRANKPETGTT
eukprot:1931294-Amphidinium_carterae.1